MTKEELVKIINDREYYEDIRVDDSLLRYSIQSKLEALVLIEEQFNKLLKAIKTGYAETLIELNNKSYNLIKTPPTPWEKFILNNPDEIKKNAGFHIALHSEYGIVARNTILPRLFDKLATLPYTREDLFITSIPELNETGIDIVI